MVVELRKFWKNFDMTWHRHEHGHGYRYGHRHGHGHKHKHVQAYSIDWQVYFYDGFSG